MFTKVVRKLELCLVALFLLCFLSAIPQSESVFIGKRPFRRIASDPVQIKHVKRDTNDFFQIMNLKNMIKFRLWTRKNPELAQELVIGDMELLESSNFNSSHLTKIIVHGFAHSANELYFEEWLILLRDAYLKMADLNVVIVDYTFFALPIFYWMPGPHLVASRLAEFVKFLEEEGQVKLSELHLIGYSWGSHVCGNAGHLLKGKIGRITGLDPANPLHRYVTNDLRLDKSDAQFVDLIHTNSGGPFNEGYLGLEFPLGHADFYPNSGKAQPGCPKRLFYIHETVECEHIRSVTLFTESILSPEAFPSCRCSSWDNYVKGSCICDAGDTSFMGEAAEPSTHGTFYLFTRGDTPYGFGRHKGDGDKRLRKQVDLDLKNIVKGKVLF